MSQTTVNEFMDQWQKGQVGTSHYVRDISRKSSDVDEIGFGELVIWGADPETEVRQPSPILAAVTGKAYAIVSGVCTVTNAAHGLEDGQEIVVANASPSTDLNGSHFITVLTAGTFSFVTAAGDNTGTLDYSVAAFTQKEVAGIVVKPVTGGRAKAFAGGELTYSLGDLMTVLQEGDVAVELGATVSANDDAFYVHTSGGASAIHTWRNDLDTDKAAKIPGRFRQAGVSGDIVLMRINIDAVLGS